MLHFIVGVHFVTVIVDYNQAIRVRSPITNRNPASRILHITNLVRPFAQCQLKELLTEDGALVDGGFWINKIKSHCFAVVSQSVCLCVLPR